MRLDKIQQNKLNHMSYQQSLKYHIRPDNKTGEEWRMSRDFWTAGRWRGGLTRSGPGVGVLQVESDLRPRPLREGPTYKEEEPQENISSQTSCYGPLKKNRLLQNDDFQLSLVALKYHNILLLSLSSSKITVEITPDIDY